MPPSPLRRRGSSRAFYHPSTASARASQFARRAQRTCFNSDDLSIRPSRPHLLHSRKQSSSLSEASLAQKRVRILVEKRLIRGTAVFRQPTEQEIDDYLRMEHSREMKFCSSAAIDIPPSVSPPNVAPIPLLPSRRSSNCVASLLSKGFNDRSSNVVELADYVHMDEYTAVALFLRRVRAHKKKYISVSRGKTAHSALSLSKIQTHFTVDNPPSSSPENSSFCLPSLPYHLLNSNNMEKSSQAKLISFKSPRSRSELTPARFLLPEKYVDLITTHHHHYPTSSSKNRKTDILDSPPIPERRRLHFKEPTDDDVSTPMRVLTAIEPVNPAAALPDNDVPRVVSYHAGSPAFDLPLFRRRRRTSTAAHADSGFRCRLPRLRSFRRTQDTWTSLVRRFSQHRDVPAA